MVDVGKARLYFPGRMRTVQFRKKLIICLPLVFVLSGCSSVLSSGRGWGEDATLCPKDRGRIGRAAWKALIDPHTWVPAAGALVFGTDDWDRLTSNWAVRHNLVFGSERAAVDCSDVMRDVLRVELIATALLIPGADDSQNKAWAKAKGLAVEGLAWGATDLTTDFLKDETNRKRPDGTSTRSFPSGHSSQSSALATLASRNLNYLDMPDEVRGVAQVGNLGLAYATAWARVEGQKHYPSDVLAGVALGHFLSAFIHDAFLGLPEDMEFGVTVVPDDTVMLSLGWRF